MIVAGVVSISQARKSVHLFFASIPLLFGIQQCCEGFLWLSFLDPRFYDWHIPAKYAFLSFAQIIWPFWIPLSFMLIEENPRRRKFIRWFLYGGIVTSLLLTGRLIFSHAGANIDGCHIEYDIKSPIIVEIVTGVLYLGAIVVAPFFSSWNRAKLLAIVNVVSLSVTELFFEVYFVSVWCFFAAVQSVLIVGVMREMRKDKPMTPVGPIKTQN